MRPPLPPLLSGILFCAACTVAAAQEPAAAPSPQNGAGQAASPLSGTWKGVCFRYPDVIALQLDCSSSAGGAVTGQLKFSLANPPRNAMGPPAGGSYQFSGQYDALSRSFSLKPGAWIQRSGMVGTLVPLLGVFDVKSNELAGLFDFKSEPNPMFFVLAAESRGDQLIADVTRSAYPPPPSREQMNQARQAQIRDRLTQTLAGMPNAEMIPPLILRSGANWRPRRRPRAMPAPALGRRRPRTSWPSGLPV